MKRKKLLIVLGIIIIIAIIGFVKSAGNPQTTFPNGYYITESLHNNIIKGENYTYSFFLYNQSSGLIINNDSVNCTFFMADSQGDLVFNSRASFDTSFNYWSVEIDGNSFTDVNYYQYGIACQNSDYGGALSGIFEVSNNGYELDTSQAILYGVMVLIVFVLLGLSLYGSIRIPFKNKRNTSNQVIEVNWNKYLKMFLIGMSYFFGMAMVWIIWNLTYAYADWYAVSNVFHFIFRLMFVVFVPSILIYIILNLRNLLDDNKVNKFIKKTGLPYG